MKSINDQANQNVYDPKKYFTDGDTYYSYTSKTFIICIDHNICLLHLNFSFTV